MELTSNTVGIIRCSGYHPRHLYGAMDQLLESCGVGVNPRSARVVLKPNLITAGRGLLPCTNGDFILAAARMFVDKGAQVKVGDSPAFGSASGVLARIGVLGELRAMGVEIADFKTARSVSLPSGGKVGLAVDALDCDLLVNLPKVKAHAQMRVTMAVKNYFGCVVGLQKPCWHMRYGGKAGSFLQNLVGLLTVLPDSLTFVDGITAMHKMGPMGGEPFDLGIMTCSPNPVAVDRALLDIINVDASASPVMNACIDADINGTDLDSLLFPLLCPGEVGRDDFKVPHDLSPIRFNPFRFVTSNIRRIILDGKGV